ncbi:hypothetical protein N7532_010501 [Penicillium argentinense]|uniref:Zn(2)-C6 fungal-type domain-containing protein n=1 Tax=Penicillium argentinense TaxID=1131581 RepID=A0A9W9EPX7_9EURO|nr:uncharacterized protein N7532_010501 [Penicillium argentinense]KAJ5085730.1 hypothetical protein N7532_010501 [Penicillium argentinense]
MVLNNRASPGCANCRSRRIKCNLLRPRCSQCSRAGLKCAGYRTHLDVIFRDQTRATVQKAGPKTTREPDVLQMFSMGIRQEEIASKIFFESFPIMGGECKIAMESRADLVSCANISMVSVGLAALASMQQEPWIMWSAREKYLLALRKLAYATSHPWEAPIEQSIGASFILSIFEMMTCDMGMKSPPWIKHLYGTMAFLYLSFVSKKGQDIPIGPMKEILEISYTITLACLINEQPVPAFLSEIMSYYVQQNNSASANSTLIPAARLFPILSNLVNTYRPKNQATASSNASSHALKEWVLYLPEEWHYHSLKEGRPIYSSSWVAKVWNYYRLAQKLAAVSTLETTTSSSTSVFEQDIIASLPFIFESSPSSYFSDDLFFVITILQALSKLTQKCTVMHRLESLAGPIGGVKYLTLKETVIRNLV